MRYAIRSKDIGMTLIQSGDTTIPVGEVMGPVQVGDIGKIAKKIDHVWHVENNGQRAQRLAEYNAAQHTIFQIMLRPLNVPTDYIDNYIPMDSFANMDTVKALAVFTKLLCKKAFSGGMEYERGAILTHLNSRP